MKYISLLAFAFVFTLSSLQAGGSCCPASKGDSGDKVAEKGKPGDGFRQAAVEYRDLADKAIASSKKFDSKAARLYKSLAKNYNKMADIKDKNAKLADKNKWEDCKWDDYEELRAENDESNQKLIKLLGAEVVYKECGKGEECEDEKKASHGDKSKAFDKAG